MKDSRGSVLAAASFWVLGFSRKDVCCGLSMRLPGRVFIITMFEGKDYGSTFIRGNSAWMYISSETPGDRINIAIGRAVRLFPQENCEFLLQDWRSEHNRNRRNE